MSDAPAHPPRRTPLYQKHVALGARMMPFGGFDMPVQYSGILDEHRAVRTAAGLFDVSHMGEVRVRGPHALAFVQHLVTNDAARLTDGRALYTAMCNERGGIVDDLLVYRFAADDFLLVVNASNVEKDVAWMRAHNPMGAVLEDESDRWALLAIQGPRAFEIVETLAPGAAADLPYYHFRVLDGGAFLGIDRAVLSHTGYTGEAGLEIYLPAAEAPRVWDALLEAGRDRGLLPAGLGARDTLRLEAGFSLYGNDLTDETTPLEAGLGWVTKLDKGDFVGRDALVAQKEGGIPRRLVGFVMEDRGIPRHGNAIVDENGQALGYVTSGSQSPTRGVGVGLGYVPNAPHYTQPGSRIFVEQRGKKLAATVQKPPFHKQAPA